MNAKVYSEMNPHPTRCAPAAVRCSSPSSPVLEAVCSGEKGSPSRRHLRGIEAMLRRAEGEGGEGRARPGEPVAGQPGTGVRVVGLGEETVRRGHGKEAFEHAPRSAGLAQQARQQPIPAHLPAATSPGCGRSRGRPIVPGTIPGSPGRGRIASWPTIPVLGWAQSPQRRKGGREVVGVVIAAVPPPTVGLVRPLGAERARAGEAVPDRCSRRVRSVGERRGVKAELARVGEQPGGGVPEQDLRGQQIRQGCRVVRRILLAGEEAELGVDWQCPPGRRRPVRPSGCDPAEARATSRPPPGSRAARATGRAAGRPGTPGP